MIWSHCGKVGSLQKCSVLIISLSIGNMVFIRELQTKLSSSVLHLDFGYDLS